MSLELATMGESMLRLDSDGPLGAAPVHLSVAGAESNVATALARLGHRVRWVSRLGDDEPGPLVRRQLTGEGIEVVATTDQHRPTGLMLRTQRTADLSTVGYWRAGSAAAALSPADVDALVDGTPRIVHLTGITPALSDTARDATFAAVRAASEAEALVSLDVNYRSKLWPVAEATPVLRDLAAQAHIVSASPDELKVLGFTDEDSALDVLLRTATVVLIKRGAAGATLVTPAGRIDQAAQPVHVVDTIGAGDACTAGFFSGFLEGLSPAAALERAVRVAAFVVSTAGDTAGLPYRAELDLLGQAGGDALR